ncbi:MAG TPA: MFS transporter [Stellaceae bacterium]
MSDTASRVQQNITARLERLPISRWHITICVVMGFALFFEGFEILSTAYVVPVLREEWHITPQQIGFLIATAFAGQVAASLVSGWIADRIGRLKTIMGSVALYSLMSLVCAFAWDVNSLAAFKFVQGLGVGPLIPVSAAYMSEIAVARSRGRFYVIYELAYSIGLASAGFAGAWIVPHLGWQALFYAGAVPAVLVVFMVKLLPESPRWLVAAGHGEEAERVMADIERRIVAQGYRLGPVEEPALSPAAVVKRGDWRELFRGNYSRRTPLLWFMWFSAFAIIAPVTTWLPTIYRSDFHVSFAQANLLGAVHQTLGITGGLICGLVIDHIGRRRWFIFAFFGSAFCLASYWAIGSASLWVLFAATSANQFCMGSVANSLGIYTAELYPTRIRAVGISLCQAWSRGASSIGPAALGFLLPNYGIGVALLAIAGLSLVCGAIVVSKAPETKGALLETLSP